MIINHISESLMQLDEWAYTLEWCLVHGEYDNRSQLQRKLISIKQIKAKMLVKQKKYYGNSVCYVCAIRILGQPPDQDMRRFNSYKSD